MAEKYSVEVGFRVDFDMKGIKEKFLRNFDLRDVEFLKECAESQERIFEVIKSDPELLAKTLASLAITELELLGDILTKSKVPEVSTIVLDLAKSGKLEKRDAEYILGAERNGTETEAIVGILDALETEDIKVTELRVVSE